MNLIFRQKIWWLASLLMLVAALYLFISFKPKLIFSLSDFIFGILAGAVSYFFGRLLQARKHKQLVNTRDIFINSVIVSPIAEEMLFRFGIIVFLFNSSLLGILTSIVTWAGLHLVYEIVCRTPFRYYRTSSGFIDSLISGTTLAVIYIYSDFNLFVPWIAHALHNLLIWLSIASPIKGASILQLKGRMAYPQFSSSFLFSSCRIIRIRMLIFLTVKRKVIKEWKE